MNSILCAMNSPSKFHSDVYEFMYCLHQSEVYCIWFITCANQLTGV